MSHDVTDVIFDRIFNVVGSVEMHYSRNFSNVYTKHHVNVYTTAIT